MGRRQLPVVAGADLNSAGQNLLDTILADPNADIQMTSSVEFRVTSNDIVNLWKGTGAGNGYFVGATFNPDGTLDYFGVYK